VEVAIAMGPDLAGQQHQAQAVAESIVADLVSRTNVRRD
jgi:hypothetical protein